MSVIGRKSVIHSPALLFEGTSLLRRGARRNGDGMTPCCRTNRKGDIKHRVSLVSAHVTTLEEDLKQQPLCQDSSKDVLIQVWRSSWPFHSFQNRDLPDTPQQSELGVRSCIIIHQNEVVTNSSIYGRTYGSRSHPNI
ncbi:hypothetical protein TNCV_4209491 [Trichonephila clavipes]|nr:hypothetical protein TNCV_4209491 [Trichonephila clavipes]